MLLSHILGSDKAFKGNLVNRELPSLHGGSLEVTLMVDLITFSFKKRQYSTLKILAFVSRLSNSNEKDKERKDKA